MRSLLLTWAFAALLARCAAEAPFEDEPTIATTAASTEDDVSTIFNGITVPGMTEIEGSKYNETIQDGWWWIKHFSPYCPHCSAIQPTWYTLYEFYMTSSPLKGKTTSANQVDLNSANSFTRYYDFHFASINCVAYGEACEAHGIKAWPAFMLYHDGEFVERYKGEKTMEAMAHFVEEKLEQIKPGSRPREGIALPEPGATSIDPDAKPSMPLAKDKDAEAGAAAAVKHNEKAASLASATTSALLAHETARLGKTKATSTGPAPNPLGTSVALTAESFQKLVTTSQEAWFIKFYAPWCHHCQALAPTWAQLAKEMESKLHIGEVNCDTNARLCKDAKVSAYPTIYYFRGGERVEYDGLRGLGDLMSFAHKAIDSDVRYVDSITFKAMEETEEVIFVYFFDHATTSEDFAALDRLTLSLIGQAKIVKTDSTVLADRFKISTWPRLLVSRGGRPTYYNALAPKDMRDFRKVFAWMQSVWLPLVPEITANNARELLDGRYTVIGILSRESPDEFAAAKRELKNAALEWMDKNTQLFQLERQEHRDAKQLRIEEAEDRDDQRALRQAKSRQITITEDDFRKPVRFAWVDGVFWERWIRRTYGVDVRKGERVIINDEDNRRYWDETETGNYIMPSRTSILETLPRVVANPPRLSPKSTISTFEGFFFQIRNFGTYHPYFSFLVLIGCVACLLWMAKNPSVVKKAISRSSSGYFVLPVDEKHGHGHGGMGGWGSGLGGGGGGGAKAD